MHKHYSHLQLSHNSNNNKYIIFLGDSYTWGQGLYLPNWLKNRPEVFDYFYENTSGYDYHLQWTIQQPFVTKEDLKLKDSLSFTNIVAKELNRNCYKKIDNGGSNLINVSFLKEFENNKLDSNDVIIIYQFSSAGRDEFDSITDEEFELSLNRNLNIKGILKDRFKSIFEKINSELERIENTLGWKFFYLDWLGDFCQFKPDKFIQIGNNLHFYELVNNSPIIVKYKDRIFKDHHLNDVGNEIVAKSILEHINKFGKL